MDLYVIIGQQLSKHSSLYSKFKIRLAEEYICMFKTFNFHFHVFLYLLAEFTVIFQHTHTACSNQFTLPLSTFPRLLSFLFCLPVNFTFFPCARTGCLNFYVWLAYFTWHVLSILLQMAGFHSLLPNFHYEHMPQPLYPSVHQWALIPHLSHCG